jgi:4-carboxymuconolactone decarboxylase
MAITEEARRNHDQLFPGHVSTLAHTDPELVEYFDNFAFDDVLTDRGIELPLPGQSTTTPETRMEHGRAVQAQIIGEDRVEQLYASAPADEQHIQRFLSANCFGDHLTRTGIDVPTRELLTFAMLVSLGGCEPQVKGHVAANLHVGNPRARLLDVLTQLIPFIGYPRTLNGLRVLDELTAA